MSDLSVDDKRRRDLAAIHAEAKKRGVDEDTRRAMIRRISAGRTASSADLSAEERGHLLRELGGRSRPARAGRGPGQEDLDRRGMLAKVGALLADQRLPWGYGEAILRRQRGILDQRIACPMAQSTDSELRGVIAALVRRGKKEGGKK